MKRILTLSGMVILLLSWTGLVQARKTEQEYRRIAIDRTYEDVAKDETGVARVELPYKTLVYPIPKRSEIKRTGYCADYRFKTGPEHSRVKELICDAYIDSLTLEAMKEDATVKYLVYLTVTLSLTSVTSLIPQIFSAEDQEMATAIAGATSTFFLGLNEVLKFKERAVRVQDASGEIQKILEKLYLDYTLKGDE